MGFPNRIILIGIVEYLGAQSADIYGIAHISRLLGLSAAIDAAAGAGHKLHKVVLEGAVPDAVQHPLDVVQAGGHADPDGLAGQLITCLLYTSPSPRD